MDKPDMENIIREAATIDQMTAHEGWRIIRQYCENTLKLSHDTWLYMDPDDRDAQELRESARTAHSIINLVENFKEEGKRLYQLWERAQRSSGQVPFDMDNSSPNIMEE